MKVLTALKYIYRAIINGDDFARYVLAERLTGLIYPTYRFSEFGRILLEDKAFLHTYERLAGANNYHSLDRKYALDQMMKLVKRIDGDTAECGAYQGASSYFICRNIYAMKKVHHVFDSFEGLSAPSDKDGSYWTRGDLAAEEVTIRENLKEFDFVTYYRGWIPTRFKEVEDRRFVFVHLDLDLYQPTWDSLCFFYPRVNPEGIILCDDYGFITCPGARQAMDEFFRDRTEEIVSLPTGQGFVIKR
jgi:hypothetical protein